MKTPLFLLTAIVALAGDVPTPPGGDIVYWNPNPESFVGGYRVYVATNATYVPGQQIVFNLTATTSGTNVLVTMSAGVSRYYIVTAVSTNGWESDPSDIAVADPALQPAKVTGVGVITPVKPLSNSIVRTLP